jgi:hypothetical protein
VKFVQIQEVGIGELVPTEPVLKRSLKHAINSLYERLRNENADFASVSSAYFRLDPSINWSSHREVLLEVAYSLRKLASSRFPKAQCYLLFCADFEHHLTTMKGKVPPNETRLITDIREEELRKLASESGALYEGNRFHFFRLPSGQTADFFLRTGNCLAKRESLHILAFWALPSLETTNLIICDTWSISTLGMYLARLAERYTGRRYDCQYLSKYLSEDIASSSEVLELLEQASDGRIAPVFLVSALSSGRSLRTYVEAFGTLFEDEKPSVVTVYLLGESLAPDLEASIDVLVLCSLADILEARGLEGLVDDVSLEEGQKIFTIDAQTYFPRYFEPKEHRFTPSKFTAKSKHFFETYAGHQIFSVCRDGSSNTKLNLRRHHAFHVDILKLVSSSEFQVRAEKLIKSLDRPTHIVHLKKPADARFAQVVSECFPDDSPIDLIECSGYRRIPKRQDILRVLADPNANVWFLDAMYISGQSTAQDFEQGLRSGLSTQGLSEYPSRISFLVGLLRPDLSAKITSDNGTMIRLSCPTRHGEIVVNSVEEVLLPNWDQTQCPWCKERELHTLLLSKHARDSISGKEKAYIEGRLTLLAEGRRRGLKHNLFFKRYPEHQFEFNKGSLWFDWSVVREKGLSESEADVMLAVASALQYWRDDYGSKTPAQYLLDQQSCFGVNVYNESFLRAAIWRSLKRREVDTFLNDSYRKELLVRVFDAGGAADATDEFVLGWEASKLLGRYLPRVIGKDRFDAIDWDYLKWTCLAI